jgi:hypothetical protein
VRSSDIEVCQYHELVFDDAWYRSEWPTPSR